jgi:hypothetical protein
MARAKGISHFFCAASQMHKANIKMAYLFSTGKRKTRKNNSARKKTNKESWRTGMIGKRKLNIKLRNAGINEDTPLTGTGIAEPR